MPCVYRYDLLFLAGQNLLHAGGLLDWITRQPVFLYFHGGIGVFFTTLDPPVPGHHLYRRGHLRC